MTPLEPLLPPLPHRPPTPARILTSHIPHDPDPLHHNTPFFHPPTQALNHLLPRLRRTRRIPPQFLTGLVFLHNFTIVIAVEVELARAVSARVIGARGRCATELSTISAS